MAFIEEQERSERELLQEWWEYLEKVWGVIIVVRLTQHEFIPGRKQPAIQVDVKEEVHREELNGFKGVLTPMMDASRYPYAMQARLALMHWERVLIEHMAH